MRERVRVEIPLKPTENQELVLSLINRIMDPDEVVIEECGIEKVVIASARCLSSLKKFYFLLRRERILEVARKNMISRIRDDILEFMLHKQALTAGRASFVDSDTESPLGAVRIMIFYPNPKEVVDWLAPKTSRGKPLWEKSVPSEDCI